MRKRMLGVKLKTERRFRSYSFPTFSGVHGACSVRSRQTVSPLH